ncbi:50S ribosomal protein L4 [Candidatus Beckwithbacteria bacterium RBG_13_42_9]|uniref:Large ribosomal subunit protein uL4 n=1 Tax=Candidatus Beckwithbacteria bacterium RBG_13_42_9 TaxID=1797457 RepID=A0A1F5E8Y0_9BACT|nr:MAG: 50S ribosomal protein L4 [Candidatus Beckwithbacteria bacterium RBG_13_42_9]
MKKVSVYSTSGTKIEQLTLPEAIFAVKINEPLMAQAVRVYLSNQRLGLAHAKTRGELTGITTAKIYRQKGTGKARHGSKRAPVFVGGGKAHGPTGGQNYAMTLPPKMKSAALKSALSLKAKEEAIWVVNDFSKFKGKTSEGLKALTNILKEKAQERIGLVLSGDEAAVERAFRNLPNLNLLNPDKLTTYEVLTENQVIFTKESLAKLIMRLTHAKKIK